MHGMDGSEVQVIITEEQVDCSAVSRGGSSPTRFLSEGFGSNVTNREKKAPSEDWMLGDFADQRSTA